MVVGLCAGHVKRFQGSSAQLKLAAWLQADALPIKLCANDVLALHHWLPAEAVTQALQQLLDDIVANPGIVCSVVAQLLVLRPDPEASIAAQHSNCVLSIDTSDILAVFGALANGTNSKIALHKGSW
jgi:hypothetical protein